MPTESIRSRLDAEWDRIDSGAIQSKDSQRAVDDLIRVFQAMNEVDRGDADDVLVEWALGSDARRQFGKCQGIWDQWDLLAVLDFGLPGGVVDPCSGGHA